MKSNELFDACELAGLEQEPDEDGFPRWFLPDDEWVLPNGHSALPSYVADLLVAKVFEAGQGAIFEFQDRLPQPRLVATPQERITAAMAVLGESE